MINETHKLLIHNCLNEVLHGLAETSRVRAFLLRKVQLERLFKEWRNEQSADLLVANRDLIIACVATVLAELGDDEFETRIGVERSAAKAFLDEPGID